MYHISDIKQYSKCPKYYHLNKTCNESYFSFYRNEYNILDIYKDVFGFDECFVGNVGDNPDLVLNNIGKYEYFVNARFAISDLRVKVSLLHKNDNGYTLFFFKPILPKELDTNFMFITYDVLKRNGIDINDIKLIYANKNYVFKDKIDFKQAIKVIDTFNNESLIELVRKSVYDYEFIIKGLKENIIPDDSIDMKKICSSCDYFNKCYDNSLDDDSIMHLVSSKYKYDMYKEGINQLKNTDINRIDCTSLQYAQIMASKNNGLFIDKNKLKEYLSTYSKNNISFIDFEWDMYLFPKYNNMKCLSIMPFEFSLYTKNNNELTNYCYVGKGDCREEFIKTLISKIPPEGTIVAFNSFSAEVLRIKELAEQFPMYKNELDSIANRFVDIAEFFSRGILYDIKFKGQLSLKYIISVISDISYNNLVVKNGLDAVHKFRKYENTNDESIKNDLVKYCNQDAYSLIVIYDYINSLV